MKNVVIKKSNIHGRGVFANRDFKKGEIIIKWDISKTISKEGFEELSAQEKVYTNYLKGKYFIMQSPAKYANSSCEPNTIVKKFCDIAIKNIKKEKKLHLVTMVQSI